MPSALNFFLSILLQPKRKRSYQKKNRSIKNEYLFARSILLLRFAKNLWLVGPKQQKIKLTLPKAGLISVPQVDFFICCKLCEASLWLNTLTILSNTPK